MKTICDDNGDTEVVYAYDLNNRLLEESNHSYANNKTDVTKYVYDNNGNQIKKIGYITKGVIGLGFLKQVKRLNKIFEPIDCMYNGDFMDLNHMKRY